MSRYTGRQVCEILGVTPALVRRLVAAGFVAPTRGRRREYLFDFRDLIVLRTAKGLSDARLSARRIGQSLRAIRNRLPAHLPLSGLRIIAFQDAVVVSEGAERWRARDGQYLLAFDVETPHGELRFVEPPPLLAAAGQAATWFARGCGLESRHPGRAMQAYRRAIAHDARCAAAYINWGRLLHHAGQLDEADVVYTRGLAACPDEALLLFNKAVLREDQGCFSEAIDLYRAVLKRNPAFADAHYNLGLLYRAMNRHREALRHLSAHRRHRPQSEEP